MSASLRGKTIAFSGAFPTKTDVIARAIKAGAIVSPNVSKKIDFLVTSDAKKPLGMKEVVAKHYGTKIVTANSFLNFVHRGGARKVAAASAAKGRVRTVTPSRQLKAAEVAAKESVVEDEAADFGPMPWMKGSRFNSKAEKAAKLKRARALKAKLAAKEAVVAEEAKKAAKIAAETATTVAASKVVETPVVVAPAAEATMAMTTTATAPAITFTPSKGLTIQFQGDFSDFCRAANQLVVNNEVAASSATTVTEKLEQKAVAPVVPVVTSSEASTTPKVETDVVASPKKAEVSGTSPVVASQKKTAGRTRTIIPTLRKLAEGEVKLSNKTVSFTGTFFQMKRAALQTLAMEAGAKVASGIDSEVDFVVVGRDAAHKKKLAKKIGIATLSEKNFISSASH